MRNKRHLEIARKITQLLDQEFSIWKFKFGLDPIIGLFPALGDIFTTLVSFYLIFIAILYKVPVYKILQMILNIAVDFFLGSIPIIGDFLDFVIKPNVKNLKILDDEIKTLTKLEKEKIIRM